MKKDRTKLTLTLGFNLTAIGEWLKNGAVLEEAEKIKEDWLHGHTEYYTIDVIPTGVSSEVYFHRRAGVVSATYGGNHHMNTTSTVASESTKAYASRLGIDSLSWKGWRDLIVFYVNDKPFFAAPMKEVLELQVDGKVKDTGVLLRNEPTELLVPISFGEKNVPKDQIKIKRSNGLSFNSAVEYSNALGWFSATTNALEVQY